MWWRTREPAGSMPAITPRTLRRFREMKSEAGGVPSNISFELTARALGALSDEENRGVQTRISKSTATDDLRRWWHSAVWRVRRVPTRDSAGGCRCHWSRVNRCRLRDVFGPRCCGLSAGQRRHGTCAVALCLACRSSRRSWDWYGCVRDPAEPASVLAIGTASRSDVSAPMQKRAGSSWHLPEAPNITFEQTGGSHALATAAQRGR